MSYRKRLDDAFKNAPILPLNHYTQYVFFSDCHRGAGNSNDNLLKNSNCYGAALHYYYHYGFHYIEIGDGDELWENRDITKIMETHSDIFNQLALFIKENRLYMIYGNHDMVKKMPGFNYPCYPAITFYEGIIFRSEYIEKDLYVTHGHQISLLNSVLWRFSRFLVRHLWSSLEGIGVLDPTSAAQNNKKQEKYSAKYTHYAIENGCLFMTGHTHRPTLGNDNIPYFNCGSCVHPKCITCIELCGHTIRLVKWYESAERSIHFGNIYRLCPPTYPVYVKREILAEQNLFDY